MAEKTQKTAVKKQTKKKASIKGSPGGSKVEAVGNRWPGGPKVPSGSMSAGDAIKAKRAKKIAQIKLAAARQTGVSKNVQPITLKDVAMTVDDPGLKDAMQFSDRLRTGKASILTPEEDKARWEESDRQIAELQRLAAQKFGRMTP